MERLSRRTGAELSRQEGRVFRGRGVTAPRRLDSAGGLPGVYSEAEGRGHLVMDGDMNRCVRDTNTSTHTTT